MYPLTKSLNEIREFCIDYQDENTFYSYNANNCRKFMIALCKFIGTKWSGAFPCEDMWYAGRGYTNKKYNLN